MDTANKGAIEELLADEDIERVAESVFSYLKATLSIRNKNIDCTVDITNSEGYTSHEPRYVYPWGLSNILLNCPDVKFSDLEYFLRVLSPYVQIKEVAKEYGYTSTRGNYSTQTAIEKWIFASEGSLFVNFLRQWKSERIPQIEIPQLVTISEAIRWWFLLYLIEQTVDSSPIVNFEKALKGIVGKNGLPKEFMDFERLFISRESDVLNVRQPIEDQRLIYVLGKCVLFGYSDSFSFRCDGFHSFVIDPDIVPQMKQYLEINADTVKSAIIADYKKFIEEDPSNALPRAKAISSLKRLIGANGLQRIKSGLLDSQEKELLESEGLIKTLPNGDIILARGIALKDIDRGLSELNSELERQPGTWWDRIIELKPDEKVKHEPPKLKVRSNSYDFRDVKQGDTPSKTFMVENTGGGTLNWEVSDYPDWLDVGTTSGTNDGSLTVTVRSDASGGDYDGTVEVISNAGSEAIGVSGHIGERGGGTFPPPPSGSILLVGYECGTGSPVNIKPAHLFISGLTQKAGKTTTLEALVLRSGLKTISFITKPNEKCFDTGEYHLPFFQEKAEWRVIEKLFEAQLGEKMKDIRAKLIELCKHEKTLESIKDKIDEALDSSKGSERKSLVLLQAYFEELFNALAGKEYTNTLDLKRGINLMDLTGYNEELQSYIINSVLNEILKNQKNTVVIIPEAWKFIPQSKSSACKYSIDQLIRQGAVNNNFVWFDSQDIAGVDKSMLKSVSIWILGLQTEINEVQHTINQIPLPKNQKPTEDRIMNLDVGVFFVCADGIAKKTYVMPKWKSEEEAKEIAISMEQFKK
jgi:hypothetical protein